MKASKRWVPRGARRSHHEHVPASYTTACAYPGAISLTLLRADERSSLTLSLDRPEAEELAFRLCDAARAHQAMEGSASIAPITYRRRVVDADGSVFFDVLARRGAEPVLAATSERDARRLCDPVVLDLVHALRVLSQDRRIVHWMLENDPLALTHARTVLRRAGIKEL